MLDIIVMVGVFVFSFGAGYFLISKVPHRLHTPLMSMTNAVLAAAVLGVLLPFLAEAGVMAKTICAVVAALATFNVISGFAVTDRMLGLFKSGGDSRPDSTGQ